MKPYLSLLTAVMMVTAGPMADHAHAQVQSGALQFITQQPANEWLARVFLGALVQNTTGENVGDINDLIFDPSGRITTVVIGVGGFLGMGEKDVAVPYGSLTFKADKDGARVIVVPATKEALLAAPTFKAIEKTTYDKVKDKAVDLGNKTVEKAVELKDEAAKKIDDMTKSAPAKK